MRRIANDDERRDGERWDIDPVALAPAASSGPRGRANHATYRLRGSERSRARIDYECTRWVEREGESPHRYVETIHGAPGSVVLAKENTLATPARLDLEIGRETLSRMVAGVCRTITEARLLYGEASSPYRVEAVVRPCPFLLHTRDEAVPFASPNGHTRAG